MPSFGRGSGGYQPNDAPNKLWPSNCSRHLQMQSLSDAKSQATPVAPKPVFDDDGRWANDWLEQLESYDWQSRRLALQNFAGEGARSLRFVDDVVKVLADEEAEVRKAAACTLGKIGSGAGKKCVSPLVRAIGDEDQGVRAEVSRALGLMGRELVAPHAEKIEALAKDKGECAALAAAEALTAIGEIKRLEPFFASAHAKVRRIAVIDVGRSPEVRIEFASHIAKCVEDADLQVRSAAVHATGEIGDAASPEHIALLGAMRSKERHVKVRKATVQALGRVGQKGVNSLVEFLRDADDGVRHYTAEVVGEVGGELAADGAAEMLGDRDPLVRAAALKALGLLGGSGMPYADSIAEHLWDDDFGARLVAINSLRDLGAGSQAEALAALSEALEDNKGVRQAAVSALAYMGAEGAARVHRFLRDPEQSVRCAAVRVFNPLHSKLPSHLALPYAPHLAGCLQDEDWRVRLEAAKALGDLHAGEFAPQLAALNDYHGGDVEGGQVKRAAIAALAKMGPDTAYHLLSFTNDTDRRVREEAEREVACLGGEELLRERALAAAASRSMQDDTEVVDDEEEVLSEPD